MTWLGRESLSDPALRARWLPGEIDFSEIAIGFSVFADSRRRMKRLNI